MFKRIIDFHLARWKTDPFRKPLLLRGARQVGKTYAVRRLGKQFKSFVEINFEKLEGAASLFDKDLTPDRSQQLIVKILKNTLEKLKSSILNSYFDKFHISLEKTFLIGKFMGNTVKGNLLQR